MIFNQVVWVLVETPKDGSPITLMKNIFDELDDILGTNYVFDCTEKPKDRTYGAIKKRLRRVLANHSVGMILLDEVQHIFESKSSLQTNAEKMNTLVELVNTISVPIILVGTYKAHGLFKDDARQGRRNTGCPPWEYLSYDECIETEDGLHAFPHTEEMGFLQFMQALWKIQYILVPTKLTKEIYDMFYNTTMGITDVICKIFYLAQIQIIASGKDREVYESGVYTPLITPQLIQEVYQDAFHLLHPAISLLKEYRSQMALNATSRDTGALNKARVSLMELGDVILPEEYITLKTTLATNNASISNNLRAVKESMLTDNEVNRRILDSLDSCGVDPLLALKAVSAVRERQVGERDVTRLISLAIDEVENQRQKQSSRNPGQKGTITPRTRPSLLGIIEKGQSEGKNLFDSLIESKKSIDFFRLSEYLHIDEERF